MKKLYKAVIMSIVGVCILLVLIVSVIRTEHYQREGFFEKLDVSQIERIIVYSFYHFDGESEAELSEEERSDLAAQLSEVRLNGEGTEEFKEYASGTSNPYEMFRIELTDGTFFDFAASMPFYIINGEKGWYTDDYSICNGINDTYHYLVEKYFQ